MALDQSALLEVLDALKAADVGDRVCTTAETVYQALIECNVHPCPNVRHDGGGWSCGSRAAHRFVLPIAAGAAPPGGSGVVRGGDGGLPARRLHA